MIRHRKKLSLGVKGPTSEPARSGDPCSVSLTMRDLREVAPGW